MRWVCGLAWLVHGEGFLLYIGWLNCRSGGVSHIVIRFHCWGRFFIFYFSFFFSFPFFTSLHLVFVPGGACMFLSVFYNISHYSYGVSPALPCRPSPMFFR